MPGLDGTGRLFAPLLSVLGRERCAVTQYPPSARTLEDHLDAVPVPAERHVLVAESFSGPLAVVLASRAPPNLAGLVLVATFARAPFRPLLPIASRSPLFSLAPMAVVSRLLLGTGADRSLTELLRASLASVPSPTVGARLELLAGLDVRTQLGQLSLPIVVLEADADWIVPSRLTRALVSVQPRAKRVVLPGPHLLLQRSPEAAARELEAFAETLR